MENSQPPITLAELDEIRLQDPVRFSILTAPDDDEPYTEAQQLQDEAAYAAVARGEYTTHEKILAEFGL